MKIRVPLWVSLPLTPFFDGAIRTTAGKISERPPTPGERRETQPVPNPPQIHECAASRAIRNDCGSGGYRSIFPFPFLKTRRRNCPVYDPRTRATSSGVPVATIRPPSSPPSGPRSIR